MPALIAAHTHTAVYYFIVMFLQLTIRVSDVNDNAPKFELPDYQAHNVDEDITHGTSILKVKATDADSGSNAEIEYLVSDDHFRVDKDGIIMNHKQLDADNNNAYYEFIVTAKDKGKEIATQCNRGADPYLFSSRVAVLTPPLIPEDPIWRATFGAFTFGTVCFIESARVIGRSRALARRN